MNKEPNAAPTPTVAADAAAPSEETHSEFLARKYRESQPDERAAFEAWWMSDVPEEHHDFAKKLLDGYGQDYAAAQGVADAWNAWKAGRAAAPQAALTLEKAREIAACCWCQPETSGIEMDTRLAEAFARALLATAPTERMSDAARDVLAERARQVSEEGFTPTRDDSYADGQLAQAGAAYAIAVADHTNHIINSGAAFYTRSPDIWPWSEKWWKPTNPRRALVKAAALILAEIERIDRAARKAEIERSGSAGGEA
ncbi:hypothetical protein [Paraburkholderia sp. SIMBA_027]|uniref:hypothetical protein n=1 Tax=Paraburkholderia sp. SIMBA_027 TaxID=3085770 RepID=UPI00397E050C